MNRAKIAAISARIGPAIAAAAKRLRSSLLALESLLTAPPFILSWLSCAIFLSVVAGYRMAKADAAEKARILEKLWGRGQ